MSQPPALAHAPEPLGRPEADPRLTARTLVLVGLMGVGKTTIGRALAGALGLPFRDSDAEVERAATRTVAEIFAEHGEADFRDGERRVIARLLTQESPHVLAFGGGAFAHPATRVLVRERAVAVWLRADLELLARRVSRRNTRPLLQGKDPLAVLKAQAELRYPLYAEAPLHVNADDGAPSATVAAVLEALKAHLTPEPEGPMRRDMDPS